MPGVGAILVLILLVVYVGVVMYLINDLYKPERRVSGFSKDIWALIIVFFSIPGMLAYFSVGRQN